MNDCLNLLAFGVMVFISMVAVWRNGLKPSTFGKIAVLLIGILTLVSISGWVMGAVMGTSGILWGHFLIIGLGIMFAFMLQRERKQDNQTAAPLMNTPVGGYAPTSIIPTVVPTRLRAARDHLETGHYDSAVLSAGSALDVAMKTYFDPPGISQEEVEAKTMSMRLRQARDEGYLTGNQVGEFGRWWRLRNDVNHHTIEATEQQAHEMVEAVEALVARLG